MQHVKSGGGQQSQGHMDELPRKYHRPEHKIRKTTNKMPYIEKLELNILKRKLKPSHCNSPREIRMDIENTK